MAKMVVALFDEFESAQNAVRELVDQGFRRDDISLIAGDRETGGHESTGGGTAGADVASGAAGGAGVGAILGGFAGLLIGLGALAIPGIGPVLAAGPLAATLAGAGIGAVTGGLIGALVDAGVPEEQARVYAEGVRRGGVLVTVNASDDMGDRAEDILNGFGAVDVHDRGSDWQEAGRAGGGVREYGEAHSTDYFAEYDDDFRRNYQEAYANLGYSFDQYRPAYRYGWDMARDPNYRDRDWDALEEEARRNWEQEHPDSGWSDYREAVRYGWDQAHGRPAMRDRRRAEGEGSMASPDLDMGRDDMAGATTDRSASQLSTGAGLERGVDYPDTNFDAERASRSHRDVGDEGRYGSGVQGSGAEDRQDEHLEGSQMDGGLMGTEGRYGSRDPEGTRYDDTRVDDDMPLDRGTGWTGASTTGSNRPPEDDSQSGIARSGFTGSDMGQPGSQYRSAEHAGSGGPMHTGSSGGGARYEEHWTMNFQTRGHDYAWYGPAYSYGESIAGDQRYQGRQWDDVEGTVRRDWEAEHPDRPWDDIKDAVRHAWDKARH